MPRGDGTGPMGVGPSGWGRGGCFGMVGGGFGCGRGMGRRQAMPYQQAGPDAELLEGRAVLFERQAAACRAMAARARGAGAKAE